MICKETDEYAKVVFSLLFGKIIRLGQNFTSDNGIKKGFLCPMFDYRA